MFITHDYLKLSFQLQNQFQIINNSTSKMPKMCQTQINEKHQLINLVNFEFLISSSENVNAASEWPTTLLDYSQKVILLE